MSYVSTGLQAAFRRIFCRRTRRPRHGEQGFTLLEALTGIAVLAIALTSLFGAYSSGITAARSSDHYARAQILAQSLLAQAKSTTDHPPAAAQGRRGPFRWQLQVRPAKARLVAGLTSSRWALYQVNATVAWDAGRTFELQTLQLARRPE